jgi:transketolase
LRQTFIQTLTKLAEDEPRIILMTADLGYTVVEPFADQYPDRFFNVGVAEQNMVGIATGLAESGFIPFLYSIATFAILRPYEFIRNGPILHGLPIRIIGVGGGFEYGHAGTTHHALEDVGVLRIQPGIRVIAPADYQQTAQALLTTWSLPGPTYYRLGKDDQNVVQGLRGEFTLGRSQLLRQGQDLLILSMGSITQIVIAAADLLESEGVTCKIMVVASINPAPISDLEIELSQFSVVLTVEAHYVTGGLGSLVAEVIADHGLNCRVVRCGVKALPSGISGSESYLNEYHGLSALQVSKIALKSLVKS